MTDIEIKQQITKRIDDDYYSLDDNLKEWFSCYRIEPKKIKVITNLDDIIFEEVWLITDNKDENLSSYRIFFDYRIDSFGLAYTLNNGLIWYMGAYGSLSETIESI